MGDFLTKPITEKNATDGKSEKYKFGACSMQGWRKSNEDAHIHNMDLGDGNSLFAVFDGHGGEQVAMFCERHFPEMLMSSEEYKGKNYARALEETFVEIDWLLVNDEGNEKMKAIVLQIKREVRGPGSKLDPAEEKEIKALPFQAGCTACVVLITKDAIFCANAGDSRAVLGLKNGKLIELSYDHKPDNEGELARIKAGGGFVDDGRVQGIIAVSRAIGDWEYKNPKLLQELEKKAQMRKRKAKQGEIVDEPKTQGPYRNIEESKKHQVTSYPDIKKVPLKPEHDFIIVACDGIWDCYTNEQAIKYIRSKREKGPKQSMSPTKLKSTKTLYSNSSKSTGLSSSPMKISKMKSEASSNSKKIKPKGETSFIIEEMMDHGIAKGDITMSDGTGTDNMTCIIVQFRDPDDVKKELELSAAEAKGEESKLQN